MKYGYSFLTAVLLAAPAAQAQSVGIGTTTPNAVAALDITATDKGLLIPRLDSVTRTAISAPPDGLMVFQTDGRKGFWYAVGGAWLYIPDKTRSGDNLGSHTATQNLNLADKLLVGQADATGAPGTTGLRVTNAGRVGIGTTTPNTRLSSTATNIIGTDGQGISSGSLTWAASQSGYVGAFYNANSGTIANGLAVKVASNTSGTGALDVSQGIDQATPGASLLRVTGAGRVGLGIGNPAGRFHLVTVASGFDDDYLFDQYAASGDQAIYFRRGAGTPASPANLAGGEQLGAVGFGAYVGGSQGYANSAVRAFYTGDGTTTGSDLRFTTSTTERLRIDASGRVGVGTTAPTSTLHVAGTLALGVVASQPNTSPSSPLGSLPAGYIGLLPAVANRSFTLPDAATVPGREYRLRNTSATNALVLQGSGSSGFLDSGSNTVATTFTMDVTGTSKSITVVSDGTNWIIFRAGN